MTERSEALAQLSRILGDDSLRSASPDQVREAVASKLALLVDGLVTEAVRSDDVFDHSSGVRYVEQRLQALGGIVGPELQHEALESARELIERW
jgi:hypothetical protein